MDLRLNDIVEMKKPHPCGEKIWLVTRVGMDIKLKCTRCGREVVTIVRSPAAGLTEYHYGKQNNRTGFGL